jgi:hypothetical protein
MFNIKFAIRMKKKHQDIVRKNERTAKNDLISCNIPCILLNGELDCEEWCESVKMDRYYESLIDDP